MIEYLEKNKARMIINIGSGANRRRRSKTVFYSGKKDLERQYKAFEEEARQNVALDITVEKLVKDYIDNKKAMGAVATTIRGYEGCLRRLSPSLRAESAKDVTPYLLSNFVAQGVGKWSPKTLRNTMGLLSASYARAVKLGLLHENPCERIDLPKQKQPEIVTMSDVQVSAFLEVLEHERLDLKVGYELCLMCGLRRSEVLGLREQDYDPDDRTIYVHQTRHKVKGERKIQDTKTAKSKRILALPDILADDIEELIEIHASYEWKHSDYLILNGFGEELSPSTFSNHLRYIEDLYGLPHVSVHGLRHTFATMLNADGVDIARISAELGHSNITTTLNKYTHVFGGATASSRGIAEGMNRKMAKSATFLPLLSKEKTAEA